MMQFLRPRTRKTGKPLFIGSGLLAVLILLFVLFRTRAATIHLEDYLSVEFDGVNTKGQASIRLDSERLTADMLKILNRTSAAAKLPAALTGFHLTLDKDSALSNDDTVTIRCQIKDSHYQGTGIRLRYKTLTARVRDLTKVKVLTQAELFAADVCALNYTGVSPYLRAEAKNISTRPFFSDISYSLNLADRYLANGTEFTVTASFSEAAAASAGYVVKDPAELTKSYTVSANPGYLTRLSELDPALLKTLQTQATDLINSWMAAKEADSYEIGSFKKNYSHGQVTAHRSYLLVLKDNYRADNIGLSSTPHNRLVLTYAIPQTLVERTATAAEKTTVTTLYLAAVFPNLALNGAGSGLAKAVTPTLLTGAAPHTDPAKLHRDLAEVNQDKYETEMLENAAAL